MPSHVPTPDRSPTVQVNIKNLIDDVQCYQTVRELRWPDGIACPSCQSQQVIKRGFDDTEPARQRYECHDCDQRFDDLTDTIFAGHHQPGALVKRGQSTLPAFGTLGTFGACHVPGPLQTDGLPLCSLAQSVASAMCPSSPRS